MNKLYRLYVLIVAMLAAQALHAGSLASWLVPTREVDKRLAAAVEAGDREQMIALLSDYAQPANPNAVVNDQHIFTMAFDHALNYDRNDPQNRITGVDPEGKHIVEVLAHVGGSGEDLNKHFADNYTIPNPDPVRARLFPRIADPKLFKDKQAEQEVTQLVYDLELILRDPKVVLKPLPIYFSRFWDIPFDPDAHRIYNWDWTSAVQD